MSGTKVTTDPLSQQQPKNENPGVVTSDSLAGQSIQQGGSFAANSSSRGVLDQPSSSTTTNTKDNSNAIQLDPAQSRADRADGIDRSDRAEGFGGAGSASLNSGAFNAASVTSKTSGGTSQNSAGSSAGSSTGGSTGEPIPASKPKGTNLHEGGEISGNEPNASYTTDIGGKNDPGRAAVQKLVRDNAATAGSTAAKQDHLDSNTPYDALGGSTSA